MAPILLMFIPFQSISYLHEISYQVSCSRREIASENYHFLLRTALFEYLDVSYLAMLSKCSCNVSYGHGAVIKEDLGPGNFMYLVKKGMVTPGEKNGSGDGWGTSLAWLG